MATFTVSERSTLWLRAISIRTSGMIPMSCKINTTNGRPVSLGGRIAMSKPSSGSFIRRVLDVVMMFSATIATRRQSRRQCWVPSPKPQRASLPGTATTRREPGNCAVMRTGSRRLAELAQMHRTYCGEIETARWNPSFKNLFRLARALGVSLCQMSETVASAPSGPVYEKKVSQPLSCWRPTLASVSPHSLSGELVGCRDQGAGVGRVESAVAAIRRDDEVRLWPRPVQRPRAFHRADYVVTALYNHARDMADERGVAQQLVVGLEESLVVKVVDLDAREGERELVLFVVPGKGGIRQQLRGGAFPAAPNLCGSQTDGGVVAGQPAVIGGEQVAALRRRDVRQVGLPGVGVEHRSAALVEPVDLLFTEEENAA